MDGKNWKLLSFPPKKLGFWWTRWLTPVLARFEKRARDLSRQGHGGDSVMIRAAISYHEYLKTAFLIDRQSRKIIKKRQEVFASVCFKTSHWKMDFSARECFCLFKQWNRGVASKAWRAFCAVICKTFRLKPLVNLLAMFSPWVYKIERKLESFEALKCRNKTEWNKVGDQMRDSLVASMAKRCMAGLGEDEIVQNTKISYRKSFALLWTRSRGRAFEFSP